MPRNRCSGQKDESPSFSSFFRKMNPKQYNYISHLKFETSTIIVIIIVIIDCYIFQSSTKRKEEEKNVKIFIAICFPLRQLPQLCSLFGEFNTLNLILYFLIPPSDPTRNRQIKKINENIFKISIE